MPDHACTTYTPGCYRCDLDWVEARNEAKAREAEAVARLEAEITAYEARINRLLPKGIVARWNRRQPLDSDIVEDGFGSAWEKCGLADCDLHVVRPGTAQCTRCEQGR